MKVFCLEHRRGFFAPRQSPIRCENRGHVLGKLDFEGEAKPPFELQWQYCCNCEHFCPIDFRQDVLDRCPVCTRRSSSLYLCDRCYTVTFESNTPLDIKNFTLTTDGAPHPTCPGCLQQPSTDLREHSCDDIGATFVTALTSCPICGERLDVGPSFPSTVTAYLKKTRASNKLNVTFDYETESFVPVEDGEFVLVTGSDQAIVLPRSARLENRRDFYEFYQDYYHCGKPEIGEVHVISPAVVQKEEGGWKLKQTGVLEIIADQPRKRAQLSVTPLVVEEPPAEDPVELETIPESSDEATAPCRHCGALIEDRYSFCWKCGKPLSNEPEPPPKAHARVQTRPLTLDLDNDDEELTVQHDDHVPKKIPFSWAATDTPKPQPVIGSVLKLVAVGLIGVLLSLVFFLWTRSSSTAASPNTTNPQEQTPVVQTASAPAADKSVTHNSEPTSSPQPTLNRPEDELRKLREKRLTAKLTDRPEILRTFVRAEKLYPDDYRFPYERAKLAVSSPEKNSRDEAFAALSLAAGKAIKSGKAPEMLESLRRDSSGDFQRLSHGRREWIQLQEALKTRDPKTLNLRAGL